MRQVTLRSPYLDSGRRQLVLVVLRVGPEGPEVLLEVAVLHELHDDKGRLALAHNAQQLNHVLSVEIPERVIVRPDVKL